MIMLNKIDKICMNLGHTYDMTCELFLFCILKLTPIL